MVKKKNSSRQTGALQPAAVAGVMPRPFAAAPAFAAFAGMGTTGALSPALRDDVAGVSWVVGILSFMMLLVPAIGVPDELLLQDTLKSMVASFAVLGAGLLFFWLQRRKVQALRWHMLMWLPLSLMFYAQHGLVTCLSGRRRGDQVVRLQPFVMAGNEYADA